MGHPGAEKRRRGRKDMVHNWRRRLGEESSDKHTNKRAYNQNYKTNVNMKEIDLSNENISKVECTNTQMNIPECKI